MTKSLTRRSGAFNVNFDHISHLLLVFTVDSEQVNVSCTSIRFQEMGGITSKYYVKNVLLYFELMLVVDDGSG